MSYLDLWAHALRSGTASYRVNLWWLAWAEAWALVGTAAIECGRDRAERMP